ncbi:MAG: RNA polymerase sigma factor [Candidatus Aminicenantales bacterium]
MDLADEERIIERCRGGDLSAYRELYARYGQPLLRTAQRMLGHPQEAEDAVQETFMKLFRGISGFRRGARFSTYLFQILNNTCLDMIRKRKPATGGGDEAESLGVSSSSELGHSLAEAVDSLPAQMKASFVLFAIEQFSQDETADILGVTVGTVKANVHRARRKLRAWLAARPAGGGS